MASPDIVRRHFREQADWCRPSPFTRALLLAMAEDYEKGGLVEELASAWPDSLHRDAFALRLAGVLHFASLTDRSEALAALYPRANPNWTMSEVWPVARDFLEAEADFVRDFLKSPPQTNEVNRSLMLLPGFQEAYRRFEQPLHLLEIGASAGLNQFWDQYRYEAGSWSFGPEDSPVRLVTDWQAPVPLAIDTVPVIASRAACDLNPIDVSDPKQAARLMSYVWADQKQRLDRLEAAIGLAARENRPPQRADALEWLRRKLDQRPDRGATVVYHSIFLHYPSVETQKALLRLIKDTGEAATQEAPFAWVCYESQGYFGGERAIGRQLGRAQVWPGGESVIFGYSDGHVMRVDPD